MSNDNIGDATNEPTGTEGSRASERVIPDGDWHPEGTEPDSLKDFNDAVTIGALLDDDWDSTPIAAISQGNFDMAGKFMDKAGNRLNPNGVVIGAGWDTDTGDLVVSISGDDVPDNLDSMEVELGVRLEDGTDYYDTASFAVSGT